MLVTIEAEHMLPPFIIEQIRKREEREREAPEQPRLELPLEGPRKRSFEPAKEESERGVLIVDI
jgi:hypothetical protein